MQSRSIRRSGQPTCASASLNAGFLTGTWGYLGYFAMQSGTRVTLVGFNSLRLSANSLVFCRNVTIRPSRRGSSSQSSMEYGRSWPPHSHAAAGNKSELRQGASWFKSLSPAYAIAGLYGPRAARQGVINEASNFDFRGITV